MASSDTPKPGIFRRIAGLPARLISRTPWLRRRYAKRILKTIDRFRAKGRPLPENLARLERQLRRIPEPKRAETVEQMMEMSTQPEPATNRAVRRAAGRQERLSGKRGGNLRPGTMAGQRQQPGQRPRPPK